MKVLVIGAGGREHALAWRLVQSESVTEVVVAPGNAGIALERSVRTMPEVPDPDVALEMGIDLVVIGPEEPLVRGVADRFRSAGIAVVGPSAAAARLEGSKSFAKDFMVEHGIPTAEYRTCRSIDEAKGAVTELGAPVVVKADGLAAGKGVTVARSHREAEAAIETIMRDRLFGDAGDVVVVERVLAGFEASIIVLVDESGHLVLPTAQDHKPIGEGNTGPNTGGMGVVAPNPAIDDRLLGRIEAEIVIPSVSAIREASWLFRGILFIGLMIDDDGPQTLEYNVRFGDPETQAILPLVDGDFGALLRGLAEGRVTEAAVESGFRVRPGASCAVIAASEGYPGHYAKGAPILIERSAVEIPLIRESHVFFAGVAAADGGRGSATSAGERGRGAFAARSGETLVTAGGRVLASTAWGADLAAARRRAYAALQTVYFEGIQYRSDIGGPPILAEVLEEEQLLLPQFEKRGGLLPVVVQEVQTNAVLMLGYTNREAFEKTRETGYATFWSTSRNALWTKGETSGDYLAVEEIRIDCDQDALLYRVQLVGGGVCHTLEKDGTHRKRCFYRRVNTDGLLEFDD